MTLRLRLVLAIMVLVLAGLTLFGFLTYSLYARSEYDRLDNQVRSSAPLVTRQLSEAAGFSDGNGGGGPDGGGGGRGGDGGHGPGPLPLSTYAELRDSTGAAAAHVQLSDSTDTPHLPDELKAAPSDKPRFFTTSSATGSGTWRVYVTTASSPAGDTLVVAVPMGEVTKSLHRLVLIETTGAATLLAILCAGAWVILRRGLYPLEHMAGTAGEIAAGDLSQRVSPSGGAGEVGQLGLALNTMLDEIEAAFAERDATEQRLRQFLADASQLLRTPLSAINGF